jgi:cephalosporin-C deacetylase-like acetyl esterase
MTIQELEQFATVGGFWDVRDQLKTHIYQRSEQAFARGDAARDRINSRAALARRQRALRQHFLKSIGGLPSCRSPLNARTVGVVAGNGFQIEKIIFESRPQTFVTANLYLPDPRPRRRGAVLFLCGHHAGAKHVAEYQRVCQTLVHAGLVVLAQDPIGQGERFSYHDHRTGKQAIACCCPEHDYAGAQCLPLGDALARYFLHDAMRGVDYLLTRPEVDSTRIGVTGNSGGGTQTSLMMLGDPRIAAAAPATFIMNRETYLRTGMAQDAEQIWPGFTTAGYDHEDILLAACPKPVRVLAVQSDFFPIEGTRRTVERCQRIWKLCGRPSNLDLVEDAAIHSYTNKLARAAAEFFARHLLGKKLGRKIPSVAVFDPAKLWCTKSGQVLGEIPGARTVHDENRDRVAAIVKAPRAAGRRWLRWRVCGRRQPCALNPRFVWTETLEELTAELGFWWSQPGLINAGLLFRESARKGRRLPVTLAVWDGGTRVLAAHWDWLRAQCRAGRAVLVVDVSGTGSLLSHPLNGQPVQEFYGAIHKFADDLLWLDDDLAALRAFDVLRALDVIEEWPGLAADKIHCYAHGKHGVYAQLAAALDKRVKALTVVGGIGSYAEFVRARQYDHHDIKSIVLRDILRHCDLPELKEWSKHL